MDETGYKAHLTKGLAEKVISFLLFTKFLNPSDILRDSVLLKINHEEMSMSEQRLTMSVSGTIVEFFDAGLVTFKVKTKLGFAFVWVWEEIELNFRVGATFEVNDAPLTFHDGYPVATIKPGVMFFLNATRYETHITEV